MRPALFWPQGLSTSAQESPRGAAAPATPRPAILSQKPSEYGSRRAIAEYERRTELEDAERLLATKVLEYPLVPCSISP